LLQKCKGEMVCTDCSPPAVIYHHRELGLTKARSDGGMMVIDSLGKKKIFIIFLVVIQRLFYKRLMEILFLEKRQLIH